LKNQIFETYGMSETLSHIGLRQIFPNEEEYFSLFNGIKIDQDERGCLRINAPELNPEILQTNDIAEILDFDSAQFEKTQFRFLGRADNVINSGGAKIFPEQLEALVKKEIPNEMVFLGVPDEVLGQKLVLVVEEMRVSSFEVRESIKSQILNLKFEKSFHKPKEIIFVDEIPRTPNGKVNRRELLSRIMK
jgi:O-succinylbenzoic acid--CoA ligase